MQLSTDLQAAAPLHRLGVSHRHDELCVVNGTDAEALVVRDGPLELYQLAFYGFELDAAGRPWMRWTAPRVEFRDVTSYKRLLLGAAAALIGNGADARRTRPLRPVSTVSSAYDSVAISALLAELGHREAVTIDVEVYDRSDSGPVPGRELGLEVETFEHPLGPTIEEPELACPPALAESVCEFIATSGVGDDVFMLPLEPRLAQTMLFNGSGGDVFWEGDQARHAMRALMRFSVGYAEFRLRVGFAYPSLPVVGARFAAPCNDLYRSEELAAYHVAAPYDRPIPRRIAEEAGASRGSFGQVKHAVSSPPLNREELFPAAMSAVMERYRSWDDDPDPGASRT